MIWSVSMLAPNFHARPRMTFGSVTKSTPRRPALLGDRPRSTQPKRLHSNGGFPARGPAPLAPLRRDDLVGVDVGAELPGAAADDLGQRHAIPAGIFFRTSRGCVMTPVTALAAATAGLDR